MTQPVDEVVITGLGALTPVGMDAESTWQALLAGRSGVSTIDAFDPSGLPTRIAGQIRGFDPLATMAAKQARRSARFAQRAMLRGGDSPGDGDGDAAHDMPELLSPRPHPKTTHNTHEPKAHRTSTTHLQRPHVTPHELRQVPAHCHQHAPPR